jgi:hypothetical protein
MRNDDHHPTATLLHEREQGHYANAQQCKMPSCGSNQQKNLKNLCIKCHFEINTSKAHWISVVNTSLLKKKKYRGDYATKYMVLDKCFHLFMQRCLTVFQNLSFDSVKSL